MPRLQKVAPLFVINWRIVMGPALLQMHPLCFARDLIITRTPKEAQCALFYSFIKYFLTSVSVPNAIDRTSRWRSRYRRYRWYSQRASSFPSDTQALWTGPYGFFEGDYFKTSISWPPEFYLKDPQFCYVRARCSTFHRPYPRSSKRLAWSFHPAAFQTTRRIYDTKLPPQSGRSSATRHEPVSASHHCRYVLWMRCNFAMGNRPVLRCYLVVSGIVIL